MADCNSGMFVVVEGPGGSGKGTLMDKLEEWAIQRNVPYIRTREPGGTFAAEYLRNLCREGVPGDPDKLSSLTEALLFNASRAENLEKVIRPALAEGKLVLCDRFYHSTCAYQSRTGELSPEFLREMHSGLFGVEGLPDLTFILDGDPAVFNSRILADEKVTDQFDNLKLTELQRVREVYQSLADGFLAILINAEVHPDQVFSQVFPYLRTVEERIFKRPITGPVQTTLPTSITMLGKFNFGSVGITDEEIIEEIKQRTAGQEIEEYSVYVVNSEHWVIFIEGKWDIVDVRGPSY